jgi:hypothetical protein
MDGWFFTGSAGFTGAAVESIPIATSLPVLLRLW